MILELEVTAAKLTGDPAKDIKSLSNHVFMLEEKLRYTLRNLDVTNFNDLGLARYENGRLQVYTKVVEIQTEKLLVEIEGVEKNYTELSATVGGIQSTVGGHTEELQKQWTQIRQTKDSISLVANAEGNLTAASIVAAINDAGSSVKISADHIVLSGVITAEDLSGSGTTVINGDNILTGQIKGINFIAQGDVDGDITNSFVIQDDYGFQVGKVGYSWRYEEDDFRRSPKMYLVTESFYDGAYTYRPAVKILGAGGVSIETESGYNPIYMGSPGGYITMDAPAIYIRDNVGAEWEFSGGALYKNGVKVL
jgi:hypothetical protein